MPQQPSSRPSRTGSTAVRPDALHPHRARRTARRRALRVAAALVALVAAVPATRPLAAQDRLAPTPRPGRTLATITTARDDAAHDDDARAWATAEPAPTLAPEQVVGIVLAALANNDADDHGLEVTLAFASPAGRSLLGPLERFAEIARADGLRPLLGHVRAERGALVVDGERATQRVVIVTARGERVPFTVTLSRQAMGTYKGCWMTDGVVREPRSRLRPPMTT